METLGEDLRGAFGIIEVSHISLFRVSIRLFHFALAFNWQSSCDLENKDFKISQCQYMQL